MRVGVEVGGTFTDLVAIAEGGTGQRRQGAEHAAAPDIGALAALDAGGHPASAVTDLVHGSTVATNAVLERKGARIAFVTTAGFRDILFLQRHDRRSIYDLFYAKPAPPVAPRRLLRGRRARARRRLGGGAARRGGGRARPDPARWRPGGYEAVAICLLNAYANPRA